MCIEQKVEQYREKFKTMIAKIEKELAEYGSSGEESYTN